MAGAGYINSLYTAARQAFVLEKSGESLVKLVNVVSQARPHDFDLARHRSELGIPQQIPIISTEDFEISIFTIPKDQKLPLHDHPGMFVISKVIRGSAKMKLFKYALSHDSWRQDPNVAHFNGGEALLAFNDILTVDSDPFVLDTPERNVHSIKAMEDCALLDIFAPPYSPGLRECNYFKSTKQNNKTYILSLTFPEGYMCEIKEYRGPRVDLGILDEE